MRLRATPFRLVRKERGKKYRRSSRELDGGDCGLTDGGNGGDDFTELELVEDGGLSGGVKTDHQDSHLLATPESIEQPRESDTHVDGASKPEEDEREMLAMGKMES